MRTLRLALAALVAALGLVALTETPSHACSCVSGGPAAHLDWSDVVFTATLTDIAPPPQREVMSSGDPNTYTFEVHRIFRGDPGTEAEVRSAMSGASCGLEGMSVGVEYLVFAAREDDGLWAGLCGGTEPAAHAPVDRVAALTVDPVNAVVAAILDLFEMAFP